MTFLAAVVVISAHMGKQSPADIVINPFLKLMRGQNAVLRSCHSIDVPDGQDGDFCDAAKILDAVLAWLPETWNSSQILGFIEALSWARHEQNIQPLQIIRRNEYRLPVAWNVDADDLADRFKEAPADETAEFLAAVFRLFLIVDDPVAVLEPLLVDDLPIDPAFPLDYAHR